MTTRNVLVVDDSRVVAKVVEKVLRGAGWEVTVARTGVEAVRMVGQLRFDVVVSDLHMPDLDGFGVVSAIAGRNPDLPVIVLSSDDDLGSVLELIRRGAFDYIVKSDFGPLVASVERALAHHNRMRELRRLGELASLLRERFPEVAEMLEEAVS